MIYVVLIYTTDGNVIRYSTSDPDKIFANTKLFLEDDSIYAISFESYEVKK